MTRRALIGVVTMLVFVMGIAYAVRIAAVDGSRLLFDSAWWMVFATPFVGMLAAAFTKRRDPRVEGSRVLRHDDAAIVEHWTHGVGTAVLLGSGIALGFLFVPRLISEQAPVWGAMNIHFVAAIIFLFGTFYYAANTLLAQHRFAEHLPTKNAFTFTVQHYGHLLGVKTCHMPPEDKYFESEKMAYIMALVGSVLIIITGLLKALAHVVDVPGAVMGPANLVHDLASIVMLAFFLAHVFFAAILPASWPVLGSMFTGYVSAEQVKKEHAGWYRRLTATSTRDCDGDDSSEAAKVHVTQLRNS
ncbi:MAG: cytochrome b/b6 domain-containing protein [Coriobacteriia bacterium]|jgi:formate dehydrogenase subunit gamma|nr:cytochrome b/b6 domain-containing protein [Coriobacteriia bacterium]